MKIRSLAESMIIVNFVLAKFDVHIYNATELRVHFNDINFLYINEIITKFRFFFS